MSRQRALQQRICGASLPLPATAKDLFIELRDVLRAACQSGDLDSPLGDVFKVLRMKESSGRWLIACGEPGAPRNFRRDPVRPHFKRPDGAWFDFAMTVAETTAGLILLGYDFELRFPPPLPPFIRYDLNLPDHHNEERDLRCHLHPGHDDLLAPAPLCLPVELLDLFIHGLRPRAPDALRDESSSRASTGP